MHGVRINFPHWIPIPSMSWLLLSAGMKAGPIRCIQGHEIIKIIFFLLNIVKRPQKQRWYRECFYIHGIGVARGHPGFTGSRGHDVKGSHTGRGRQVAGQDVGDVTRSRVGHRDAPRSLASSHTPDCYCWCWAGRPMTPARPLDVTPEWPREPWVTPLNPNPVDIKTLSILLAPHGYHA